jgi:hypothetical protein
MHRCFVPRKCLAALALTLTCCVPALAASLEQIGTPDPAAATMQTYGVDVPVKTALKALLPAGWQLFVHRSVELPPTASWTLGQTWVQALEAFARAHRQTVLVDWNAKAVYFRSADVALEEGAQRAQTAQAATTPLPRLAAASTVSAAATAPATQTAAAALPATAAAPVAPVATAAERPAAPIVASQPTFVRAAVETPEAPRAVPAQTPEPVAITPKAEPALVSASVAATRAASAPAALVAGASGARAFEPVPVRFESARRAAEAAQASVARTSAASRDVGVDAVATAADRDAAMPPQALQAAAALSGESRAVISEPEAPFGSMSFNRAPVDEVLAHAARLHGYSVSFEAPAARFPGAMTLLGADMGEELRLAVRALGPTSPVRFELYRDSQVVRVLPAAPGASALSVLERPFTGVLVARVAAPLAPPVPSRLAPASRPVVARSAASVLPTAAAPVAAAPVAAVPTTTAVAPAATPVAATPPAANVARSVDDAAVAPRAPAADASQTLSLQLTEGESLRTALEKFLKAQGFELRWNLSEDLQASWPVALQGSSVSAVLGDLMPRVNLSADIYLPSSLVVVRAADAALDK